MADDLERRAIIAAHDGCGCDALTPEQAAIVALWREDRDDYQGRYETSHDSRMHAESLLDAMTREARLSRESTKKAVKRAETAEAEVRRLTDWKGSAMTVMSGLQVLGKELGLPLGESITGTLAAEAAHRLRVRAEDAETAIEQARAALLQGGQTASIRARAALAALDGTEISNGR